MGVPPKRRLLIESGLCGFLAVLVAFALRRHAPFTIGDEGFQYLLSRTWASGEPLHQRFDLIYPAGQYLWFGTALRLGGDSLTALRFGQAVLVGTGTALIYAAIRRCAAAPWIAGLVAVGTSLVGAKPQALFAFALVASAALHLAIRVEEGRDRHGRDAVSSRCVALTSVLAGALAGFREDCAVLALLVALAAVAWRRRSDELVTHVLPGLVGGLLPWLVVASLRGEAIAFAAHVLQRVTFLVERLWDPTGVERATIAWPRHARHLARMAVPFVGVSLLFAYGALLVAQVRRWLRRRDLSPPLVTAALLGLTFLPQFLLERPNLAHLRTHLPVAFTVLGVAAVRATGLRHRALAGLLAASVALTLVPLVGPQPWRNPEPYPTEPARRIGAALISDTPPWAGLPRRPEETMIVIGWGSGWYLLEGLEPGTRFLSTHPRHLDPADRREMIADLRRPRNRWVLVSGIARVPPHPELLQVVTDQYREIGRWRSWSLWERR